MKTMKHSPYPYSDAFDLAPNAGIMDDKGVKAMARDHGSSMKDLGTGHHVSTAEVHNWGDTSYSQEPQSNGSMNYMSVYNEKANKTNAAVKRTGLHYNMK